MAKRPNTFMSARVAEAWGGLEVEHLVLANGEFIVYLDESLDIEWKTTPEWDQQNPADPVLFRSIIIGAAKIEADDWDYSDEKRTRNFKRQIAEALGCALEGDYDNAQKMLEIAEEYRLKVLKSREGAVADHIKTKEGWFRNYRLWTASHYAIGTTALLFSTLVASRPSLLNPHILELFAWFVAFLTGLLTFLTPDKKAGKYLRAWSTLTNQITRYKTDRASSLESVLSAHQEGQAIITDLSAEATKASPRKKV